jgi:hypothetical protein
VTLQGYDINARFVDDFGLGGKFVDVALTLTGTRYTALEEQIDADAPVDDRVGEAGFPEWAWVFRSDFSTGNWGLSWRSRYVGDFELDPEDVVPSTNGLNEACVILGGPTTCVDKHFGDAVWYHELSGVFRRSGCGGALLDQRSFQAGNALRVARGLPAMLDNGFLRCGGSRECRGVPMLNAVSPFLIVQYALSQCRDCLQGLPSGAFFSTAGCVLMPDRAHRFVSSWHGYCS